MKQNFKVLIDDFKMLNDLPGYWDDKKYSELLEIMEYGDTSEMSSQDIKDMCLMSLSDNEPEDAAEIILNYIFKDRLNAGQILNLSHNIIEEKMWEEYAEVDLHEDFFNAHQILYEAYNGKFPKTEVVKMNVTIEARSNTDLDIFKEDIEAPLLRLLVKGMEENTLINRLYKDEITGNRFEEAKHVLWQINDKKIEDSTLRIEIISSGYWLKDLKYVEEFEGQTHADRDEEEEEVKN